MAHTRASHIHSIMGLNLQYSPVNLLTCVRTAVAAAAALILTASCAAAQTNAATKDDKASFAAWRTDFTARAVADGHDRALVETTLAGIEPDLKVIALDRDQPEFVRPIWIYLDSAVSQTRVENGLVNVVEHAALLKELEKQYGVDRHMLVAVWALESAYGAVIGDNDVVRSLATLAWDGRRRALFERELRAVFTILAAGEAKREDLIGGWAGAMGQTQFMPSTYVAYAIDHDGDGRKDLWADTGDALASAAHYLDRHGWVFGAPWGVEVALPANFDYALADGKRRPVSDWAARAIARADDAAWSQTDRGRQARLLLPAGAGGPAFLTFKNFDVIKRYNNATAYALAAGLLGDRLAGHSGVAGAWPRDVEMLTRAEVKALQRALTKNGYATKGVDGKVGPNTRAAIRAWQRANGWPADAFPTKSLLAAVSAPR